MLLNFSREYAHDLMLTVDKVLAYDIEADFLTYDDCNLLQELSNALELKFRTVR